MPVDIRDITSEVTVFDTDSLVTDAVMKRAIDGAVKKVLTLLAESQRKGRATEVRRQATEPFEVK
jgi:hypothetical protein